jgi:NAD(P)H-flavin reductase
MAAPAEVRGNPYRPELVRIVGLREETPDVRTLQLEQVDTAAAGQLGPWRPGQFGEFCVFGAGESVFALANAPTADGILPIECTFRAVGRVTNALRRLSEGDVIGFRGPFGNHFPVEEWVGRHLVFIGGGIGMAALRAVVQLVLRRRADFGEILILNGARRVADMVYRREMEQWAGVEGVRVLRTVDPGGETSLWEDRVGLLPDVFESLGLDPAGRVVIACGPPVMLGFLFRALERMGYQREQVVTTLENKMKCGVGLCGRCNVGRFLVCRDGPVVTWAQLEALPSEL